MVDQLKDSLGNLIPMVVAVICPVNPLLIVNLLVSVVGSTLRRNALELPSGTNFPTDSRSLMRSFI